MRRNDHCGGSRVGRADSGYTLTEILVVMAVIGLIAAVLTPGLIGQMNRARAKTAQMQMDTIAAGVEMFRSDVGHYPTGAESLNSLFAQPANAEGWTGPYLKDAKVLKDPWGHAVQYTVDDSGQSFSVKSYGADGAPSGFGLNRDIQAPASQ
ncbi:type II secretion system major pseudopilin GspG [Phenylobacterium sp.]|uniref:type II secretion system major pseudopilin GspG n=1 Tax=Phenylobacterium sp. TaxID=1871053 RepID=UPI00286E261D|nr:type II secretion system major pseudopilin GspG [Phenylobacterium sp.]